jgi:hypothetical protein
VLKYADAISPRFQLADGNSDDPLAWAIYFRTYIPIYSP